MRAKHSFSRVDLVWNARWTVPKALYLLSRYTPFLDLSVNLHHTLAYPQQASPEICDITYSIIGWSMIIGIALTEGSYHYTLHAALTIETIFPSSCHDLACKYMRCAI
ncbi:hypothetical protein OF83DRAFT_1105168, partial [Amylostereum chailletii]